MRARRSSRHRQILRTFGRRLKAARERAGFDSAAACAKALEIEPHTYRYYERGQSEPQQETLLRICALLNITPNDLLPGAAKAGDGRHWRDC